MKYSYKLGKDNSKGKYAKHLKGSVQELPRKGAKKSTCEKLLNFTSQGNSV